jgi:hypothetical protein
MAENKFQFAPSRVVMAGLISFAGPFNETFAILQRARHQRRIDQATLTAPPIFILGHWRSGTTLLHELMMLDPRLSFPNTFQCFAPSHFLVSEWVFHRFFGWILPSKRPMDNVAFGWDRPQEDEFALMNMGLPSPYRRMAFPRRGWSDIDYLDFANVSSSDIERWLTTLHQFLKAVTVARPGRLVLKSPTHTGRAGVLADYFEGAKFVHITRDPRALFPSTMRLWQSLDEVQGLQKPPNPPDRDYVIHCLKRMYASFHASRSTIPPESIIDIRYEDLVADPLAAMRLVYEKLDLGDFSRIEAPLEDWIETNHRGYQPNENRLPEADEQLIRKEWADYFSRYGYD